MTSRILLLYLRTGGGHLAPARAIGVSIEKHFGGRVETVLVDGLEGAGSLARFVIEDGYRILQSRAKWLYELIYALNKIPWNATWDAWLASMFIKPALIRRFRAEKPTKVVILHFLLIKPTYEALRECGLDIPVITVVTDPFTAHRMWFLRKNQNFVVFSERLRAHCIKIGIAEERVAVFPFVLAEKFSSPLPPRQVAAVKQRLGFSLEKKTVLILGGGDGIPRGATILRNIIASVADVDVAIVCGKNQSLFRKAEQLRKRSEVSVKVFSHIDIVHELISIADVVISKGGASTCMEILMMKKIPIVTDFIWEQEKGNVEFLTQNKVGFYEPHMNRLPGLVNRILTNESLQREYASNLEGLRLRRGTDTVAKWVVEMDQITGANLRA